MAWWWPLLVAIEGGWVIGAWLLLSGNERHPSENGSGQRRQEPWWRFAFAWVFFVYHLPLSIWEYFATGWWRPLLQGTGWWGLVEATIIGAVTVGLYGTTLSWILA